MVRLASPRCDEVLDDGENLLRPASRVPPEVLEIPAAGTGGEVALLVERLGVRAEVKPSAVCFEPETYRRYADVGLGHDLAVPIADRILQDDGRDVGIVEAQSDQLLEPRVRDAALERDRGQLLQEHARARQAGTVKAVGGELDPAQTRASASRVGEGAAHEERIDDRAEIGQRSGQSGALDAIDGQHVGRIEGGDVMGNGLALASPPVTVCDTELDEIAVGEGVDACSRAAARCEATACPPSASVAVITRWCQLGSEPTITRTPG